MKRFFFLLLFIFQVSYTVFSQSNLLDSNILWKSDGQLYYTGFQIHPNGNIIANVNTQFYEIDGNTGKQIRMFQKIDGPSVAFYPTMISNDGKYFTTALNGNGTDNNIQIYDYSTGNMIKQFVYFGEAICFLNDSKRLVLKSNTGDLSIYDIEKDKLDFKDNDNNVQVLAVSDNKQYIATAGAFTGNHVVIRLRDAETLEIINEHFIKEFNTYVFCLKFSPDSKYLGCIVFLNDLFILNTDDLSEYKHYSTNNVEDGVRGFCFIDSNFIGLRSKNTSIIRLQDDKQVFFAKAEFDYFHDIELNKINNSLVVIDGNIIAYDLNKKITSVKDVNPVQKFSNAYSNGILSLENIQTCNNLLKFTLIDLNGRLVKQIEKLVTNGRIDIPIKLMNGTYILNIKDGGKVYSEKFIVKE